MHPRLRVRALALAFALLFSIIPAWAFQARVVDAATGQAVVGATVSIVGQTGSATTDADGRFVWSPDPVPPFQVIVILADGAVAKPALVSAIDHAAVTTITLQGLVDASITVSGVAPSIDATPAAGTTLLSGQQVVRRAPANLMQSLEAVPGVSQVSEGQAAVPALRGLARGRTLILIDGARVTSERRVGPSATFLDPSVVEGVDVARGPGSVAYGSDALGGVISVRTKAAAPGTPLRGQVQASLGEGVPEWRGSLMLSQGFARGGLLVEGHAREADDYEGGHGEKIFNSGWEDRGFLVRFDHALGRGVFSAGWQADFGRDIERPRNNSRAVRFYYPYENSHRVTFGWEAFDLGGFEKLALHGFAGTYEQRTDQDRFATPTRGRSIERADIEAKDAQIRLTGERDLGRIDIEVGIEGISRFDLEALDINIAYDTAGQLTSEATNVSIESARRLDAAAFVHAQAAATRTLLLSAGLRVDDVSTKNTGGFFGDRSTSNASLSGFAAATVGPFHGFSVTAQVARGFRDPTLSDRYYRGPTGRGFITGNPDLEPETSLQYDLALRWTIGATRLAAYAYHYEIDDLVERFEDTPDFFFFRNRGEARLRGYEFEMQAPLGRDFAVEIAAQTARGTSRDDDADLDDMPADSVSLTLRREFGARGYANARLAWFADDDRPGPTEIETKGYSIVDLGAGWRVSDALEFRAHVRNLLDREYVSSPDARNVLAPGRSAMVTLVTGF